MFVTPLLSQLGGMEFFGALAATGYMMPLMNIVFLLVAIMLLSNRYVPLALVLLAPIMLNVVLFNLFLDFASGAIGYFVALINVYLMFVHIDRYRPILRM
jgi:putative oxidoreductase